MPSVATLIEYDAPVDARKRVTLRGVNPKFFHVIHQKNGVVILKPQKLVDAPVSARTLRGMEAALKNIRAGKRSKPVDLKKLAAMKL